MKCDEPISTHIFGTQQRVAQVDLSPIRVEEVKEAVSKQKENESPEQDLIKAEMLKALGDFGIEKFTYVYNKILQSECVPRDWRNSINVGVPK